MPTKNSNATRTTTIRRAPRSLSSSFAKKAHKRSSFSAGIFFATVDLSSSRPCFGEEARRVNWNSKLFAQRTRVGNLKNSSHRKVAETTRRAHASTSKSARRTSSTEDPSPIEHSNEYEGTFQPPFRRGGSVLLYQFWRLKKASWRVD